jgi:hypothetical protein
LLVFDIFFNSKISSISPSGNIESKRRNQQGVQA